MARRKKWNFDIDESKGSVDERAAQGAALYEEIKRAEAVAIRDLAQDIEAAKNRGFKQVYKKGWERMKVLAQKHHSTTPLLIYTTLCEFSGSTSAVVASHSTLSTVLGVSVKTVNRACDLLAEEGVVRRFRVSKGGAYCYCLNPDEVWGAYKGQREVAPWKTMTLLSWADQDEAAKALIPTLIPPSEAAQARKAKKKAEITRCRQQQAEDAAAETERDDAAAERAQLEAGGLDQMDIYECIALADAKAAAAAKEAA
jgi:hypothetical protein